MTTYIIRPFVFTIAVCIFVTYFLELDSSIVQLAIYNIISIIYLVVKVHTIIKLNSRYITLLSLILM
jgi:DMSO/TMAO reductase YedYZ heme-binding membrane subunit